MADEQIKTIVTKREDSIESPTVAVTPGPAPNVLAVPLPLWRLVAVRALRVYLQCFAGFLSALTTGTLAPIIAAGTPGVSTEQVQSMLPHLFWGNVLVAASLAGPPTFLTLMQNATELLARLDEKSPQWRA